MAEVHARLANKGFKSIDKVSEKLREEAMAIPGIMDGSRRTPQ